MCITNIILSAVEKKKKIHRCARPYTHSQRALPSLPLAEIDLPLCPRPVVIMGLSDRPAMIAQGKWDRGGSRRMMEKSFLSPMERSIILTQRGGERERGGLLWTLSYSR